MFTFFILPHLLWKEKINTTDRCVHIHPQEDSVMFLNSYMFTVLVQKEEAQDSLCFPHVFLMWAPVSQRINMHLCPGL